MIWIKPFGTAQNYNLPALFLCVCTLFAVNLFSQNSADFVGMSAKLASGTIEEKRDVLFSIRNIGTEEASQVALPALNDSSEIVRATAVASVIFLEKDQAAGNLIPLLSDPSIYVRRETAYALGNVRSVNAVDPLIKTLQNDKALEVRIAAAIALGQNGNYSAIRALSESITTSRKSSQTFFRRSAARSIGQIARNVQFLEFSKTDPNFIFDDANWEAKNSKYVNLTIFPEFNRATEVLIKMLQTKKESNDAKREAAFALGEIADNRAISVLQEHLKSEDELLASISLKSLLRIQSAKIESNP